MIAVRKYKQFIKFYEYIITSISYEISYVDQPCVRKLPIKKLFQS